MQPSRPTATAWIGFGVRLSPEDSARVWALTSDAAENERVEAELGALGCALWWHGDMAQEDGAKLTGFLLQKSTVISAESHFDEPKGVRMFAGNDAPLVRGAAVLGVAYDDMSAQRWLGVSL